MSKWNGEKFSVYTSEEKSTLGLIKELGKQTNFNTDEIALVKESDNKKVSHSEMKEKYKIDENINFTGSWWGIKKPSLSQEGLSGIVEQLQEITLKLEEKENLNNNIQRKFKPTLGLFLDLNPSGGDMISEERIVNDIKKAKENGIESIVVQPWVVWDRTSKILSFKNDVNRTKFIVSTALENGLKVSALKIHMYGVNATQIETDGDIESFKTQYKNLVFGFVNSFKGMNIGCVVAFNESTVLYGSGSNHIEFVNDVIIKLKETGFPITISTMGARECVNMDTSVKVNLDLFCINSYPKISFKMDRTTLEDSINAWNNSFEYRCYLEMKRQFPTKRIIMSETGCNDFWVCLTNPGDWKLSDAAYTGGLATSIMLEGLYNSKFNDIVKEVWWCYFGSILNDNCKEINKRYLGGVKNV